MATHRIDMLPVTRKLVARSGNVEGSKDGTSVGAGVGNVKGTSDGAVELVGTGVGNIEGSVDGTSIGA
jgi:hypothetical protein